ncbi:hypothetical protein F4818DRAFT_418687 [Hypoxylon cercidicola]|nr:hypothetical protein F4818DRAFT_418687 [Hypoxylon cercidicola]
MLPFFFFLSRVLRYVQSSPSSLEAADLAIRAYRHRTKTSFCEATTGKNPPSVYFRGGKENGRQNGVPSGMIPRQGLSAVSIVDVDWSAVQCTRRDSSRVGRLFGHFFSLVRRTVIGTLCRWVPSSYVQVVRPHGTLLSDARPVGRSALGGRQRFVFFSATALPDIFRNMSLR